MSEHETSGGKSAASQSDEAERHYLVYSREHNAWWRPNGAGYCNRTEDAGRYTYQDAVARCNSRSVDDPDYPAEVLAACPDAMRAMQAENKELIDDINRVINKCAELEAEIDRLGVDAQISEGVAEHHIGENTLLKRAIRDAIDGLSTEVTSGNIDNITTALCEALEHFTDE